jgi:hypothetical protein
MKFKTLKKKNKDVFVFLERESIINKSLVFTGDIPCLMTSDITLNELKNYYSNIDFDEYEIELVEYELIEVKK